MLDAVVLSFVLSQPPVRRNTCEDGQPFCFYSTISQFIEDEHQFKISSFVGNVNNQDLRATIFSTAPEVNHGPAEIADKFHRLAAEWALQTNYISSTEDITSNSNYQEIIRLGWDAVPLLLKDLRENQRFWFPALTAITGIRPFDPSDAGNSKRMVNAWLKWGTKKGLI